MDRLHLNTSQSDGRQGKASAHSRSERKPTRPTPRTTGPLKFPPGGVFGIAAAPVLEQVEDALSIARGLEQSLDQMQARLDELEAELEDPFVFPFARLNEDPHDSRPLAA
ncbi:MAG: hypothetical protein ACKVZJ_06295 [Phycisphaerales bacterium]